MKFLSLILIFISSLVFAASPNLSRKGGSSEQGQYVYVEAAGNAGQAVTALSTDIPFTEITDTNNAWDGDSFTVPAGERGAFSITSCATFSNAVSRSLIVYKNGTQVRRLIPDISTSAPCGMYTGEFADGDIISIRVATNGGTLNSVTTVSHYITIVRIPGTF